MIHILRTENGSQASVTHQGAQVISWTPANQSEQLFLSKKASCEPGTAIRGGIPVIFPQFAQCGPLPKHGFARTECWQLRPSNRLDKVVFELRDNDATRAVWPHPFLAELTVVLLDDATLEVELAIQNTGSREFSFTSALHTYLRVEHIEETRVVGLYGLNYQDAVTGIANCLETQNKLLIQGQVDRIYINAPNELEVHQIKQSLSIQTKGFADAVIWNPGAELGATLTDLEQNGYDHMLCVEAAAIVKPIRLQPGAVWRGFQRLRAALI